ncbi:MULTISPECIES: threonine/homoserine exporter RhtA [Enterobacterales]|uniref:threonine/homoserine exporter RhtA n=1 Tax=Enterobacterales TaxID=91347 RepID=UPI0008482BEF|nr:MULTISPECIES: threonine/homoserine exporter RhtA [Enterobacterales]WOO50908.1 threonine/homoserine exporter RhtA [Hafnia alvei]MCK9781903.1 threonine/homoserine exporter RhtA [Proteus columbae]ODQ07426.1 threonine/homoserine exporter RhtA [Shigella sp. FC130]OEI95041.1 threonine/homoserine exporter RhtA [Shigella sp. FC1655]WPF05380.1 threonine/homoserine exporter RhtA [Proteus vulgaris]
MLSARHSAKLQVFYPVLLLLLSMLSIQSGASLAKTLFPVIGAPAVTALRLLLGTLILFFIFKPWRLKLTRESIMPLFLYGLSLGAMNYLFYLALETIPLGIAVALEFTGPLAVAMFSSRRAIDFLWIILVIAGLGLLLPIGDNIHDGLDPLGMLYALGAGVGWALYIVFGQRAGKGYGAATVSVGSLIAAFIFVPIGMLQSSPDIMFSWSILPIALAIAILSTAFPYTLEMVALTRLPAKTFGTLMSLEPCMGAFIGIIFLHEHLTLIQWVALAFIVLASIGSTTTMKSKTKIEEVK